MNTENTKHPFETVEASADVMELAEMILSDCGCSTSISDRLQRRVAGRIQQHMDSALGGQQQAEPVALSLPFFAYDSEVGFERFATEAEAKQFVQEFIDEYRHEAGEGWPEEVESLCWGVVLGTTREVALPDEYSGDNGLADDMKPVDYVLTDAQSPAVAAAAPDVVEQIAQQWDGCMYDIAAGCHIDIGQDIRQAGQRLAAAPQAAVPVQTIKLGLYGRAFDSPQTRRAYTYQEQPDNLGAYKLGRAVLHAAPGGDSIDHGLSLLKALQAHGFGVFELSDQQKGGA